MLTNFNKLVKNITLDDYQSMAGPDWPSYEHLQSNVNIPQFVIDEIEQMYAVYTDKLSEIKTFCVLPFYGKEYPTQHVCCLMTRHDTVDRVRQDMLNNRRAPECSQCWKNEDNGLISDRMIKNRTFDFYRKKDITELFAECKSSQNKIQHYKIDSSNICNAACVTCDGGSSSLWLKYEKEHKITTHKVWSIDIEDPVLKIDFRSATCIGFRGGEPTLSKTNFKILEQLIKTQNTDCFISFTTNGAFDLTEYQLGLLKQFKNINFCFSIDGIGKVFEYLRYPLSWDKILKNLELCQQHNILTNVSYTLSNINIFYYKQTTDWFDQHGLEYLVNPVYSPSWFRPAALSQQVKDLISNNSLVASNFLASHNVNDIRDFELMKQEIIKQDLWKGISIADYLPEFAELIK